MDIALIIGVVLGMVFMIGSIAYALFVEGAAGGFGNFVSIPSFGIAVSYTHLTLPTKRIV